MSYVPDKFTDNQKALEYIGYLAVSTGTDISSWDITQIFAGANVQSLTLDVAEINKRFFEKKIGTQPIKKKKRSAKLALTDEQIAEAASKRINQSATAFAKNTDNQKYNLQAYERYVKEYEQQVEKYTKAAEKCRAELTRLQDEWEKTKDKPLPDLKQQIKKVAKEGYFSDFKWHDGHLWCLTKEVFMRSHAVKTSMINLGRFALKIDMSDFSLKLYPYENNLFYRGKVDQCHPFHDGNFRLCATQTPNFIDAIEKLDFPKYMELIAAVLQDSSGHGSRHYDPDGAGVGRNPALQAKFYPK